jgi:Flp pilus assembly protein TadB
MSQQPEAPVSITSARPSHSDDIRRRQTKYLVSMGVRTVCFVLAVVFDGPLRWVFVAAAFALPYFAVVIANAADGRRSAGPAFVDAQLPQIGADQSHHPTPTEPS